MCSLCLVVHLVCRLLQQCLLHAAAAANRRVWSELAGTPIRPSAKLRSLIAAQSSGLSQLYDSDSSCVLPAMGSSAPLAGRMEDGNLRQLPTGSPYSSPTHTRLLSTGISQRLLMSTDVARSSGGRTSGQGSVAGTSSMAGSTWGDPKRENNSQYLFRDSDGTEYGKVSEPSFTPGASGQVSPQHSFLMPYSRLSGEHMPLEEAGSGGDGVAADVPTLVLPLMAKGAASRIQSQMPGLPGLPESSCATGASEQEDEKMAAAEEEGDVPREDDCDPQPPPSGDVAALAGAGGAAEWGAEQQMAWHEVEALPFVDPVSGNTVRSEHA